MSSDSRFVQCPICAKPVPLPLINGHLDSGCKSDALVKTTASASGRTNPSVQATFGKRQRSEEGSNLANTDEVVSTPTHTDEVVQPPARAHGSTPKKTKKIAMQPLAERMRPRTVDEYLGQHVMNVGQPLRVALEGDNLASTILWGPPGTGKTSLARLVSKRSANHFVQLSAVTAGVQQVREIVQSSTQRRSMGIRTILFVDEIHRFNKAQQDAFLPSVEDGTIILIGATTENPSFQVNSALLSRCRVFVLEKLGAEALSSIIQRAVDCEHGLNGEVTLEADAVHMLAVLADGDARVALNALELAVGTHRLLQKADIESDLCKVTTDGLRTGRPARSISTAAIKVAFQKSHLTYDRSGDQHYNLISALHKSMRGSDANAALYWLGRMLEGGEEPLYIARRLIRFASEDIGLADPQALVQATTAFQACHVIGMPECDVILAQATAYLSRAPKSVAVYAAYKAVKAAIMEEPTAPPPMHILNAPTSLMKQLGYGRGYKYNPDYSEPVDQTYLPDALQGRVFLDYE